MDPEDTGTKPDDTGTVADPNGTPADPDDGAPSTPEYAKAEDVAKIGTEVAGLREGIGTIKDILAGRNTPTAPVADPLPEPTPTVQNVSDADINKAFEEGNGAVMVRQMVQAEGGERIRVLEQKLNEMQGYVDTTLAQHGERISAADTDGLPYRNDARYKAKIDADLAKMSPRHRAQPLVQKAIHDRIIGLDIKALLLEARETGLRAGRNPDDGTPPPGTPPSRPGMPPNTTGLPTVLELLGEDAEATLTQHGWSADEFSKKMGYKEGWSEYAAVIQKQKADGLM